jgi:hypothetical protein
MKIHIDTVVSSPDAELPLAGADHDYTILKSNIKKPKIGLFELWRMKKFIEESYTLLYNKKIYDEQNPTEEVGESEDTTEDTEE